jgi:hypothetical protein
MSQSIAGHPSIKELLVTRNVLLILFALVGLPLIYGCEGHLKQAVFAPVQVPVDMIYDDDCDGDIDCAVTQPIIHHWIDIGIVKTWGMVSSAPSKLGAPTMKVFQKYYGHEGLFSIGAWTPSCRLRESSAWNSAVVGEFDTGDTCASYPQCGTILRQAVANYIVAGGKTNGLTYVITGQLSCEEEFRATQADAISLLTGAQMEQQFLKEFVLMNSYSPSGLEYNCKTNAVACSAFFTNVTSTNGYPPVYVVPFNTGAVNVVTQVPVASLPLTNPSAYAFNSAKSTESPDEDPLAVEFAVFGSTGWKISAQSANLVDTSTGENSWKSKKASGQYYLSTDISPIEFENILANPWVSTGAPFAR